jgi:enhancing lycopene biosynthesis protein 2
MGRRVAFLLSGCGNMDGTEIHEGVSALIALDRAGYQVTFFAPDVKQARSIDYVTGESHPEKRNALSESARIARGDIRPLSTIRDDEYDAVVIPGGFGAALTLCSFATEGTECSVNPEVEALVRKAHADGKPIAAMCIAPVLLARCLSDVTLTIGNDSGTASAIENMGCTHVECPADDAVSDPGKRVVTTPAYMLAGGPAEVFRGAERMVEELSALLD